MKKILIVNFFLLGLVININAQCWRTFVSGGNHSLAIREDGTLWAWGFNSYGQLGDGTIVNKTTPVQIGTSSNWKTISAGAYYSMGIKEDGTLWAWGYNNYGQLGDGTLVDKNIPTQIGSATDWQFVNLGASHSIVIKTNGTLWAWGYNFYGQLGDGTTVDKNSPVQIGVATNWKSASGGDDFTLAIQTNGTLWGFGRNAYSELGDGTTTQRLSPVQIGVATNWSIVQSAQAHSLAIKTDGTLWSWGYNTEGALGAGAATNINTPFQVDAATNWKSIGVQYRHSIVTKTNGTLWTCGYNASSQLGDGTTTNRNILTQVGTDVNWSIVDACSNNGIALKTNGTIWGWGTNFQGQIGDGTTVGKTSPVVISNPLVTPFASATPTAICTGFSSTLTAAGPLLLDQKSITGTVPSHWFGGNSGQQTFVAGMTGKLVKVRLHTATYGSTANITLNVYSGVPGSGILLTSVSYFKGAGLNSWDDVILPGTGVNLTSGSTYYLEIPSGAQVDWMASSTNVYANGQATWAGTPQTWDWNFETYMDLNSYVWNPGSLSGSKVTVSPSSTTNYTVAITYTSGCANSQVVSLAVSPISVAGTASSNQSICSGSSPANLSLSGNLGAVQWQSSSNNITWTNIVGATSTILTSAQMGPLISTYYYRAVVTSGACSSVMSNFITITVNSLPVVTAISSSSAICAGSSVTLTAGGATTYLWNTGATTFSIVVSPTLSSTYTVTGTSSTGCVSSKTVNFTVNPTVTSSLTQTNVSCNGGNSGAINLTVSGGAPFSSAPIVDQQQGTGGCGTTYSDFWQSFTPSINGLFTSIDIRISTNSATIGNWYVYSGSGTGGTLLSSGSYNFPVQGGALWKNLIITGSPALIAGQQYTFRMDNVDWTTSCATNLYSGGTDNYSTDRAFMTYMSPAPYNYLWSNSAVTEDITNLAAGPYTVTVTDANSCVVTKTASITQPTLLNATTVISNVLCNGGATGAINLTPIGGTPGYTFNWGGGITTEDRTGLPAGVYTCTITDANGCLITKTSTVTQSPILSSSNIVTNVSCNGTSTGAINLTPIGGTPVYTFNWGGGIVTEDRTGLPAGAYTCTITDVNSCTITASAVITQPASALTANTTVTNILCNGGATGVINLTPIGGTPGYTFNWGGGITSEDRTGLPAGVYTCTVTDANGCLTTKTSTVTQSPILSSSNVVTNVSCNGTSTGVINLTPVGGTPGYTFNWGGGITTEDRSGLIAGVYTCTVTDINGCNATISSTVTQPATSLTANTTVTNVLCFGAATGAINLTPTGGTPGYTFNWGGGIITEDRTGLSAGVYTCTITDANGCLTTKTSTVTQPATFVTATTTVTNVLCIGESTGAINLTPSGGTAPYTFNWGGGIITEDITGITAGAYTCTITDVNSCTITASAFITQPATSLTTNTTVTNVLCFGSATGAINLTATGGTPGYTFNWGGGITTEDRSGLPAGAYSCTVTDVNTCTVSVSATVVEPSALIANAVISTSINCNGGSGVVTVSASGGTPTYSGIGTFTVVAGTYTYTVIDLNGCVKTTTINVTQPSPLTITVSSSSSSICVGATASLNAIGASTYTWNPGLLTGNTVTVSPTATTVYTATGTTSLGCIDSKTISLVINSNPTVTASSSSTAICAGESTTLTAGGATTYSWSSGSTNALETVAPSSSSVYTVVGTDVVGCVNTATLSLTVNALPIITINSSAAAICSGLSATLTALGANTYVWSTSESADIIEVAPSVSTGYTVTGTDVAGCINTETINLTVNPLPTLSITASSSSICVGATATLTASGASTYSWSTGSTLASIFESPGVTTIYTVTGTDIVGCVNTETVNLIVNTLPTLTVTTSSNAVCAGNSTSLTAIGATTYSWSTGATTSSEVVSPTATTLYTVVGTDAIGCMSSDTIRIFSNSLPNILTNVNTNTVCLGGIVVFSNLGANTFTLSPSALTGSLVNVPMNTVGVTIYTISGTGPLGCTNTNTVSITTNALPSVSISPSNTTICVGQSIVLNGLGANTYTWSGSGTVSNSITDAPSVSTSYSLTGTDSNGCENTTSSVVNVASTPVLSVNTPSTNVCMGYTTTIVANGASNYTWSTGATTNSITVQPFVNTTYSVVGSNGGTCTDTVILSLTVLPLPSVSASASNTLVCSGQIVNLSATGTATIYAWNPGTLIGANQSVQINTPTTFTLAGQGSNGCAFVSTVFIDTQSGTAVIPMATPNVICIGDSSTLSVIGGSVPSWSSNIVPNTSVVSPSVATTYTYSAVDINGCVSDIEFTVNINVDCDIIVYNGFTPNGDGINDFLVIDNIDKYPNNNVFIYNRWGNKIYNTSNYDNLSNNWDGTLKGQVVTSGTYFYIIGDGDGKLIRKGWIEITN